MGIESIETIDLEVFLAVVRNEGIGAAAQELRFSGASVSTRIVALERKLGTKLFDRTSRGSFTTAAGIRFRDYATGCLSLLAEARQSLRSHIQDAVTIAVPASLGNTLLAPALTVLSDSGIPANGKIADTSAIVSQVVDGTVDIGFVVNGIVPRSLVSHRLSRSQILPVARPNHPLLSASRRLAIDDLDEYPVAIYRWNTDAEALGQSLGDSRRSARERTIYIGLPTAIIDLVVDAGYIGLVAEFALSRVISSGIVSHLPVRLPSWTVDVDLIYRRNSTHTPAVHSLVDHTEDLTEAITIDLEHEPVP